MEKSRESRHLADAYLRATNSVWSGPAFKIFIDELQQEDPLQLEELWLIPPVLKFRAAGGDPYPDAGNSQARRCDAVEDRASALHLLKSLRDVGHADWVYS